MVCYAQSLPGFDVLLFMRSRTKITWATQHMLEHVYFTFFAGLLIKMNLKKRLFFDWSGFVN